MVGRFVQTDHQEHESVCTVASAFCVRSHLLQPSFINCEVYCALTRSCKRANRRRVRRTLAANRPQSHPVTADDCRMPQETKLVRRGAVMEATGPPVGDNRGGGVPAG